MVHNLSWLLLKKEFSRDIPVEVWSGEEITDISVTDISDFLPTPILTGLDLDLSVHRSVVVHISSGLISSYTH